MLKFLRGRQVRNSTEAATLVFEEAGVSDVSLEAVELFSLVIDTDKLMDDGYAAVSATVRNKFQRGATWSGRRWLIPVPGVGYDTRPIPRLDIAIQTYQVASIEIKSANYFDRIVIGPIGRIKNLILPMSFLQALLDDDLGQMEIVGRDSRHTTWGIPGLKEGIRLPDSFTAKLPKVLRRETVAGWLLGFGSEGKKVAPWVVGTLIGLQRHGVVEPSGAGGQPYKRENVIAGFTQLYGREWAEEMFAQGAPFLRANMTEREAEQCILREAEKLRKTLHKEL